MDSQQEGLTRREALKRGAAVGGAMLWASPVVQTIGMSRAAAAATSPVETNLSFIALLAVCDGVTHFIKYEIDEAAWESSPGNTPGCVLPAYDQKSHGGTLGFSASAVDSDGCVTIGIPGSCTVVWSAIKCATNCYASNQNQKGGSIRFCCP